MDPSSCKSHDDIVAYLISSLKPVDSNEIHGDWVQKFGFRRAMMIHQVWHHSKTGTWTFHVSDEGFNGSPNMGTYPSLSELLKEVAYKYKDLWKLGS